MKDNSKDKGFYIAMLVLAAIALIFSLIIAIDKASSGDFCDIAGGSCDLVQNSRYASLLGIDNSYYGIAGFTIMILLLIMQLHQHNDGRKFLIIAGSAIAGLAAIVFIYLQAFVIHSWCIYCLIVDVSSIILMILGLLLMRRWR